MNAKEDEFKFEPIWLTVLSLLMIFSLYNCFSAYDPNRSFGLFLAFVFPVAFISSIILPLGFKMITGVPAIVLTDAYFINNMDGLLIEWQDISEMHITTNFKGLSALIINLKQPEKYFNSPLRKIKYQLRQLFTANDISIPIDFVAGKKDEIFQVITAHWSKHDK